jgi:hypothetical protein
VNAHALLEDLRSRDVRLDADGERLIVDAPVGTVTEEIRTAIVDLKPKLLKLLEWEQRKLQKAGRRGLIVRWSEYPKWIKLHDPTTGEWHEVRAEKCLPKVVETANKYRKTGGVTRLQEKIRPQAEGEGGVNANGSMRRFKAKWRAL